jgi:hypothetical protein
MYLVLFAVGLLVAAVGLVTIGFGIPINAFSLGNTLIISGTTAVVGGLVLIGLAAAIRQLNRIAVAIGKGVVARPAAPVPAAPQPQAPTTVQAATAESLVPPTARIPQAVRTAEPVAVPRPEPRFPAATSEPSSGPLDWLRAKPANEPQPAEQPPVMDVADEAPLSPRAPQRPFSPPAPSVESQPEPRAWMPPSRGPAAEPRSEFPPMTAREPAPPRPTPERREPPREAGKPAGRDSGLFDVVWPDARSKQMPGGEPAPREPKADVPPQRPRDEPRVEKRAELAPAPAAPAILKSGVIDGMAYTLYVDGSIEAELPQGTVRFASVDALRAHLEKTQ